ncbi:MAG: hypothetical protein WC623_24265 [Pedobacter sp.]|uniref:hypothetical protein n=1 Tax=Pedobacter sp. TaxID=1411316 RepID=UPI00356AF19B
MIEEFENLFTSCEIYLDLQTIQDAFIETQNTDKSICGHCDFWLKSSQCPKEHNITGRNVGPSANSFPCSKYIPVEWIKNLKLERIENVNKKIQALKIKHPNLENFLTKKYNLEEELR